MSQLRERYHAIYMQLIGNMKEIACLACRPTTQTHFHWLQVSRSKCLRQANDAPLHNRQIHEHLDVLFFADHIGALAECFHSILFHVRYPHYVNLEDTYDDPGFNT
jgi:hypothetical protein